MARVQLGSIVTDIRGKLGGQVFKQSSGGLVIQTKRSSKYKATGDLVPMFPPKKRYVNNEIKLLWNTLTAQQRETWQSYMEWKNGRFILKKNALASGLSLYSWFSFVNYYNSLFSHTLLTVPSFVDMVEDCELLDIVKVGGGSLFVQDTAVYTTSFKIVISLSRRMNKDNKTNRAKNTTILKEVNAGTTSHNLTTEYLTAFGELPQVGDWIKVTWDSYKETLGRQISKKRSSFVQVVAV